MSTDERNAHNKDVDVYWQANAWADVSFSIDWVTRILKPAVMTTSETKKEFVLFCDNLSTQTNELFLSEVRKLNGIVWFELAGATVIWQPVDCGFGYMLTSLVRTMQDECLQSDNNIDLSLGNGEEKLDAKQQRILITRWVGEAYNRLSGEKYASSRCRCFEKTGCFVTADGSGDDKIQPEGLPGYSIPPPLPVFSPENPLDLSTPELSATSEEDDDNDEDEQHDTEEDVDENETVDSVKDRIYDHAIINHKIRAFYDDWHTGEIIGKTPARMCRCCRRVLNFNSSLFFLLGISVAFKFNIIPFYVIRTYLLTFVIQSEGNRRIAWNLATR